MKQIIKISITIIFIISLLFTIGCGKKEESKPAETQQSTTVQKPADATYELKSAIVTYEMSFLGKQTQTLYIDDWGKKEARYSLTEIEMMGIKSKTQEVEINADGFMIKYDVDKKTGTKMKSIAPIGAAQGFPKDLENITKEIMDQFKLKDLGKKEFAGKECRGFSMDVMGMNSEVWIWKNIPLYTKVYLTKDSEPMEIKASKIEVDVPIPAEKFQVPADIKITQM